MEFIPSTKGGTKLLYQGHSCTKQLTMKTKSGRQCTKGTLVTDLNKLNPIPDQDS